jgi:taurine dioxygenase
LLRAAWLRFKVVFFRDQDISHESHVRLGRFFGELEGHPVIPSVEGYPEILRIEGVEGVQLTAETVAPFQAYNKWHTDVTFRERPSITSILRARHLPPLGGDTMWADTVAAYAGLPQPVKDRIEGLEAEHDIVRSFGGRVTEEKRAQLARDFPPVRHPVVRSHPETGEKILYVNYTFTSRIIGVSEEESDSLLRLLFDRIKVPEYQVRFRWTPNAIGIWDNRSTQHYAVGDYWPEYRALERVTVSGDVVTR